MRSRLVSLAADVILWVLVASIALAAAGILGATVDAIQRAASQP